jgi:Protein of unknown function (DUF1003)
VPPLVVASTVAIASAVPHTTRCTTVTTTRHRAYRLMSLFLAARNRGITALLTTALVLVKQNRQARVEEHRAHLDLQVNLLAEQKKRIESYEKRHKNRKTLIPKLEQRLKQK